MIYGKTPLYFGNDIKTNDWPNESRNLNCLVKIGVSYIYLAETELQLSLLLNPRVRKILVDIHLECGLWTSIWSVDCKHPYRGHPFGVWIVDIHLECGLWTSIENIHFFENPFCGHPFGVWIVDIHWSLDCGHPFFCGHHYWRVDCGPHFFSRPEVFCGFLESTGERLYKTCKTKKQKLYPFVLTC